MILPGCGCATGRVLLIRCIIASGRICGRKLFSLSGPLTNVGGFPAEQPHLKRPRRAMGIDRVNRPGSCCAGEILAACFGFGDIRLHGDRTMNYGYRLMGFLCTVFLLVGCGESRTSMDTRSYYGAFNMIVSEVDNLDQQVNAENYRGQSNPIEDQLGSAIHAFMRNADVKGTPLEAEAQKLADQEQKILEIWNSPDGSVEKIRAVVKEMQEQLEHMKTMI